VRNIRTNRSVVGILIACVLVLGRYTLAYAHAALVSAEPAAKSHVASSPGRVRLVFSEPLEPSLAQVYLVAGDGHVETLTVGGDPHDVHALIAPVADLADGAYRVAWRIVSADGHPVDGSYVFWVGAGEGAPPPDVPHVMEMPSTWGPSIFGAPMAPSLFRGLGVGFLMAVAGFLWFFEWCGAEANIVKARTRVAIGLALAAAVFVALHLLTWMIHASPQYQLTSQSASALFASTVGRVELARAALAVLVLWALWLARRRRLALTFAIGALLVSGASGHPAAISPMLAMPSKAVHLLAVGAWVGGLLWLVVSATSLTSDDDRTRFLRDSSRVSATALVAIILVALSGLVQTFLFLPKVSDLFTSAYGAIALAKIAGLLVLVAFGAYHRFRMLPSLSTRAGASGSFGASLRAEVGVMTLVILLGGLLAYIPPPSGVHSESMSSHMHME
jgi:copper transport protein